MNDKERIERLTTDWQSAMDLGWLSIKHLYSENFNEEHLVVAETEADWEYRQAKITWFLPRVAGIDDHALEEVVVHELCHVLTAPIESELSNNKSKQGEYAVECLSRAILSTRANHV